MIKNRRFLVLLGIFLAFGLGIIISATGIVPQKIYKNINMILTIVLVFLLFGMGLNIGLDKNIILNIFNLGIAAFLISLASVAGSVLFVWYFGKKIFGDHI